MPAEIEELREKLKSRVEMAEKDFLHSSVLNISQKLDKLIIKEMKSMKN